MLKRFDDALSRLADSEVRFGVLASLKTGCEAVIVIAPAGMGVLALPWFLAKSWAPWAIGGAAAAVVGAYWLGKGAGWLETRSARKVDQEHAEDVAAALRALHLVLSGQEEPTTMRQHVLRSVEHTVHRLCPRRGGAIFAALLVREGDRLRLCAYSRYREGRVPKADLSMDHAEGAARAYRQQEPVHVPDTQEPSVAGAFPGKRFRSLLAYPLMDGETCLGVLAIDSPVPHHFAAHLKDIDAHVLPFLQIMQLNLSSAAARAPRRRAKGAR